MFLHARNDRRPFHLGPHPREVLPSDPGVLAAERAEPARRVEGDAAPGNNLGGAISHYLQFYAAFADGEVAPAKAPAPDSIELATRDIAGGAYFMDASLVGVCELDAQAAVDGALPGEHTHAVVIVVEHPRRIESGNLAHAWTEDCDSAMAQLRGAEIAITLAAQIRNLGYPARAHIAGHSLVDHERLAILAGLAVRDGDSVKCPFLQDRFSASVITTAYELTCDTPLARNALRPLNAIRYWWGINGARSGREIARRRRRASHLSQYPMETVKRVPRPTTLILDDEVPRVPKRANFFMRARFGDLGAKAQREVARFAYKTPFSVGLRAFMSEHVPHQDGETARREHDFDDPAANARAIKSLAYYLGADLAGICEVPNYAWYSHHLDGRPIEPYHRYGVVMLIDQGYETMEAASGDDWVSGAQSMRAYLRGAQIAGVMAEMLRRAGYAARSQTNMDSDVLQIPLVLLAGLGELSRIGELVLNPFVGPRFKSVVLTTDLPLAVDQPIDFGLQTFCNNCLKCARECPCDAIPFGDKVMFNGYEIWKPDVERCTRYRVTNQKGSACGRCMKTCPINKVVDADGPWLTRMASWLGVNALWLKPVLPPIAAWADDRLGHGRRNLVKKWWLDYEMVEGKPVLPRATNQRDIDPDRKIDVERHKVAYQHASMMPAPDAQAPVVVDRKAGLAAAAAVESPLDAAARVARGEARPAHYKAPEG